MRTKLKDICIINPKSPGFQDDLSVSFVPMSKIGEQGEFDPSEVRTYQEVKKGFTYFQNGDILFAKITPCMENGKGAVARSLENGVGFGSTEFHVLRPLTEFVTSEWLFYLLNWQTFRKEAERNMIGSAGQKRVPKTFLEEYSVDIPVLEKQREMTNILNRVCNLISLRKQQLAKLDELVKARFVEMFGDPVSNSKYWNMCMLGERCKIITGNTPPRTEPGNYGTFIEWIKSDNINTPHTYLTTAQEYLSKKGFEKSKYVDKGSLLMTCIAGSINCIGNIAISDRMVAFNQQINAIIPYDDDILYLYWMVFLSKPVIQNKVNNSLKGILSKAKLSTMKFPFPPHEIQAQFSSFCSKVEKQKLIIQRSFDRLEVLRKSLMQEYFR